MAVVPNSTYNESFGPRCSYIIESCKSVCVYCSFSFFSLILLLLSCMNHNYMYRVLTHEGQQQFRWIGSVPDSYSPCLSIAHLYFLLFSLRESISTNLVICWSVWNFSWYSVAAICLIFSFLFLMETSSLFLTLHVVLPNGSLCHSLDLPDSHVPF